MERIWGSWSDGKKGEKCTTYEDASAAYPHGRCESAPVVVPLQVAVAGPRLGLVLAHAVDETSVEAHEGEEGRKLQSQPYEENLQRRQVNTADLITTIHGWLTRDPVCAFFASSCADADIEPPAAWRSHQLNSYCAAKALVHTWVKNVKTSDMTNARVILRGGINTWRSPSSQRASRPRRTYSAAMKPHGERVTKR